MSDPLETALRDAARSLPVADAAGAGRRRARRAADEGLLDVAYATADSPLGPLLLAATERGVVRLAFDTAEREAVLEQLARRVSPRVLEAPTRLDPARRQLEEFFAGRRRAFDVPLDLRLADGFRRRVLEATAAVPYGGRTTYTAVAGAAGSPRGVRAAGTALAVNPLAVFVPCHRVLPASGALGGYAGGPERKRWLLELEGGGAPTASRNDGGATVR